MKLKMANGVGICLLAMFLATASIFAQEAKQEPRFSHKGVKGAIAFGSSENEFGRNLEDGEAGALSLGYGFDDRFTLWLTGLGVQHPENAVNESATDFGGLELNLQYKFLSETRAQPYGKVGVGVYGIEEEGSDVAYFGTGFAMAIGMDYFFSRHFGVGAELFFKELDYSQKRLKTPAGDLTTDLNPQLDGESRGFMISFTIQ